MVAQVVDRGYSSIIDMYITAEAEHLATKPKLYKNVTGSSTTKPFKSSPLASTRHAWNEWMDGITSSIDEPVNVKFDSSLVRRININPKKVQPKQPLITFPLISDNVVPFQNIDVMTCAPMITAPSGLSPDSSDVDVQVLRHHMLVEILFLIHFVSKAVVAPKKQLSWGAKLLGRGSKSVEDSYSECVFQYTLLKRELWNLGLVEEEEHGYGETAWFSLYQDVMVDVPFSTLVERYSSLTF